MKLKPATEEHIITHGHLFCGVGVGARGFNLAVPRIANIRGKFVCVGGIDNDAGAIANFTRMTGTPGTVRDLFSLDQYITFHGKHPPAGWVEAGPEDIRAAFQHQTPDVVFLSAPCKGFSGLLASAKSSTAKYQALNALTLRGVWLTLEAYKDDPIPVILFENVPRIQTRGRKFLDEIIALLRAYGYSVNEDTHDCGVIGGLATSRKRFLLIARHATKVPPFIYQPKHHKLRGVGEVIGKLPLPGDPVAGPMHRVPALQWKTWVRLAFVPAGKDWRALNDYAVEDGFLTDFGIMPERSLHHGSLGVVGWEQTAGVLTSQRGPLQGRFSVADVRYGSAFDASLGVVSFSDSAGAVQGKTSPSNGKFSVADPRIDYMFADGYGVHRYDENAGVLGGASRIGNGAYAVADIRPAYGEATHPNVLGVLQWNGKPAGVISSEGRPTTGAFSVADVRVNGHPRSVQLGVRAWDKTAPVIKGDMSVGGGPFAVADVRLGRVAHSNVYRVVAFDKTAISVTSSRDTAVADPRPAALGREYASRKYKVTRMEDTARAVIAASTTGDGAFAVADFRPPWSPDRHRNILRITNEREHAGTISGARSVTGGMACVADSRIIAVGDVRVSFGNQSGDTRKDYQTGGHYGVVGWPQYAGAISGHPKYDGGRWSVADPREVEFTSAIELPKPDDRLVCRIIATDNTWHRPFTTLDLAALQSLFDPEEAYGCEDGIWFARTGFDLVEGSDVTKREWIGNAVPGAAGTGMAETIGEAVILARIGESFMLSSREIWVKPGALALAVDNMQPAFVLDAQ